MLRGLRGTDTSQIRLAILLQPNTRLPTQDAVLHERSFFFIVCSRLSDPPYITFRIDVPFEGVLVYHVAFVELLAARLRARTQNRVYGPKSSIKNYQLCQTRVEEQNETRICGLFTLLIRYRNKIT